MGKKYRQHGGTQSSTQKCLTEVMKGQPPQFNVSFVNLSNLLRMIGKFGRINQLLNSVDSGLL